MKRPAPSRPDKADVATEQFQEGLRMATAHPLIGALLGRCMVLRHRDNLCPADGWAIVVDNGEIHPHPTRREEPAVWAHVLAHCALHLGMGHLVEAGRPDEWGAACCAQVLRFLKGMKFGRPPPELALSSLELASGSEEQLYREFCLSGVPKALQGISTAGPALTDLWFQPGQRRYKPGEWQRAFAQGVEAAVHKAVREAAGVDQPETADSPGQRARGWFINHFPLLGALAMACEIIEDPGVLGRLGVTLGAVVPARREIFLNGARLAHDDEACRFVLAHELLHIGLLHDQRCQGRDPFLWNVACDYVINDWLIQMGVGQLPPTGLLHDITLRGLSAEQIYDRMVTDLRRYRKLATLRGVGLPDVLPGPPGFWSSGDGVRLDELYREYLTQGLLYHQDQGRGLLPAGLVEEIRALSHPAIPWDVELAQWFDRCFAPLERTRSFAHPSRRQSAVPDIPLARWVLAERARDGRTFGVVLDTSASMERDTLARALGAIASYSVARDVPAARVVFCDAAPYDQGYLPVEHIATRRVAVKGRGGTVLQPAIDLLEGAKDFPEGAPILIITDGRCDRVQVRRTHAYLLPHGQSLPFPPKGDVFRIR